MRCTLECRASSLTKRDTARSATPPRLRSVTVTSSWAGPTTRTRYANRSRLDVSAQCRSSATSHTSRSVPIAETRLTNASKISTRFGSPASFASPGPGNRGSRTNPGKRRALQGHPRDGSGRAGHRRQRRTEARRQRGRRHARSSGHLQPWGVTRSPPGRAGTSRSPLHPRPRRSSTTHCAPTPSPSEAAASARSARPDESLVSVPRPHVRPRRRRCHRPRRLARPGIRHWVGRASRA